VDLEAGICASAGLPEGTRFQLEDEDGDTIVLSNSIPNMTRLTLKVIEEPGKGAAAAAQKKWRHSGGSGSAEGYGSGAKKLRVDVVVVAVSPQITDFAASAPSPRSARYARCARSRERSICMNRRERRLSP
jgi:hypothetical protein